MNKRLQVLLDESELREVRRIARLHRMTVTEWVRRALRTACRAEPSRPATRKLAVIKAASRHEFPVSDIGRMLAEIEQGYNGAARP